jgi:hypothetical protein
MTSITSIITERRADMAYLDVYQIEVVGQQELSGDELYLNVNGNPTETTPELGTGGTYIFNYDPVWFSGTATVHLYESDPGGEVLWWDVDPDDYIDTAYISDTPAYGVVEWMDGDGGLYDVHYSVWA